MNGLQGKDRFLRPASDSKEQFHSNRPDADDAAPSQNWLRHAARSLASDADEVRLILDSLVAY